MININLIVHRERIFLNEKRGNGRKERPFGAVVMS